MMIVLDSNIKAFHPLFFLVELSADPRQRETERNRLDYLLEVLQQAGGENARICTPLWIQTYGVRCIRQPIKYTGYTINTTRPLLDGAQTLSLAEALENLNQALSRSAELNFSLPMLFPTVFLLGNPAGTPEEYSTLADLDDGVWFFHCRRWLLTDEKLKHPDLANRFVGFLPKLFQKNPRILPAGFSPKWEVFLKDFRPDALHTLANMDAIEPLPESASAPEDMVHVDPPRKNPDHHNGQSGPVWDEGPIGPGIPAGSDPRWDEGPIGPGIPAGSDPRWEDVPLGPGIPAASPPVYAPESGYRVPIRPEEEMDVFFPCDEDIADGYIACDDDFTDSPF